MNISGTTNTCTILGNTPFILSGLSQTNLSTVNITDVNGLDVSQCYDISTSIITVNGDNVIHSGNCDTSLEIIITSGVDTPVECLYTGTTEQTDGLILFLFTGGTTSLNIHPDCCTTLGYTPEIGVDHYYVCRYKAFCDPLDCSSYSSTNQFDANDYLIFEDKCAGGTTTIVPSEQCCIDNGFIGSLTTEGTHCIVEVPFDPCEGLTVKGIPPTSGDIIWNDPSTGGFTNIVPNAECCSSNEFNSRINPDGDGFICYNSLTVIKPTVSITNDDCCTPDGGGILTGDKCCGKSYIITLNVGANDIPPSIVSATYLDCNGAEITDVFPYVSNFINLNAYSWCTNTLISVNLDGVIILAGDSRLVTDCSGELRDITINNNLYHVAGGCLDCLDGNSGCNQNLL